MKKKTNKLNNRRKEQVTLGMTLRELNQPVNKIYQIEADALAVYT